IAQIEPSRYADPRISFLAISRLETFGRLADHPVTKPNPDTGVRLWSVGIQGDLAMNGQMLVAMLKHQIKDNCLAVFRRYGKRIGKLVRILYRALPPSHP